MVEVCALHRPSDPAPISISSDPDALVDPITLDQIFKYYDFDSNPGDPEIEAAQRQRRREMCQLTIDRINRSLPMIRKNWPHAKPLEIYIAFTNSCGDPEEMIFQITNNNFLENVRSQVRELEALLKKPKHRIQKTVEIDCCESDSASEFTAESESESEPAPTEYITKRKHKRHTGPTFYRSCPKEVDKEDWNRWSDIHRTSYLLGMKNPNSYLYRNLPPGEKQNNGAWSAAEKELFMARLKEMGRDGPPQWGIFSQAIPGRVGYQCANFYRKLLMDGEIKDPMYVKGPDGKLHFIKRKKSAPESRKQEAPVVSWYEKKAAKNPLPGEVDFVTKTEIRVPTMSPDGYILDYNTWLNILKEKPEDPFTNKHINKRQLVVLTRKNIDEYRDRIKNLGNSQ